MLVPVPAAIIGLLDGSCPPAIAGLIISVAIWVSVDGVRLTGALSHVGQKIRKVIPALTYRDPEPCVIFVPFRVPAPAAHLDPTPVGRRSIHAVLSRLFAQRPAAIRFVTTTSTGTTVNKIVAVDQLFGSAVAATQPFNTRKPLDNRPLPEPFHRGSNV